MKNKTLVVMLAVKAVKKTDVFQDAEILLHSR